MPDSTIAKSSPELQTESVRMEPWDDSRIFLTAAAGDCLSINSVKPEYISSSREAMCSGFFCADRCASQMLPRLKKYFPLSKFRTRHTGSGRDHFFSLKWIADSSPMWSLLRMTTVCTVSSSVCRSWAVRCLVDMVDFPDRILPFLRHIECAGKRIAITVIRYRGMECSICQIGLHGIADAAVILHTPFLELLMAFRLPIIVFQ